MGLFKQNEYFYKVKFFLTELSFLKGDTNIYFEYITLSEKKRFLLRKIIFFVKIIHIFFLKKNIFFQIVFLHLNNHNRRCSVRKGVLRNFEKFTGKHLCQSLFFSCNFIKKEILARCFPANFAKFLRTPFLQNTFVRLLLKYLMRP